MPSASPEQSARVEKIGVTHAAVSIASPGKDEDEEKNQDSLMLLETTDGENAECQFAIVCDGATSSPYSAAAAQYVSGQVHALFEEGGLREAAAALKGMRLALLEKPVKMDEGYSALLKSMFEEIVREKYQSSYQTTFVAVCLKRGETNSEGMISIKAIGCGDSAVFIFGEDGELHYNNMNLGGELERLEHRSSFTAVLPDSYDPETNHVLVDFKEYPEDVNLLLCSDGFYDGFTSFKEIREWLQEHRAELTDSGLRDKCLSELHARLNRKKGDDDISFIWLHPVKARGEAEAESSGDGEEHADAETSERRRPGFLAGLFEAILRLFGLRAR
ncbi:MAG TPA: protein phosphatase 2C domain-containing protein [Pyrinomonadaceae bacterium]|jgi:serine/threonine protein phosphatase PrpC